MPEPFVMRKFLGYWIVAPVVFLVAADFTYIGTVGASDGRSTTDPLQALVTSVMCGLFVAAIVGSWVAGGSTNGK